MFKVFMRKLIPTPILSAYHYALARLAGFVYGHPSEKLTVIGVTGTNGKSTTVEFIGRILEHAGNGVGWTGTNSFKVADKEWANDKKMTMLGRFQTQKMLREMVRAGCKYAVVETSSQGIAQFRHVGINYDLVVFTNLTPEHIEAHGGFEAYKRAKGKLFEHAARSRRKRFGAEVLEKASVVNVDDPHAAYFLSFGLDRKYGYGLEGKERAAEAHQHRFTPLIAKNVRVEAGGSRFSVSGVDFHLQPAGLFNVRNALAGITAVRALGLDWGRIRDAVAALHPVPGRLERVDQGQPFTVLVDYAYEPAALEAVYETVRLFDPVRVIHVLGSAGGGRDVARRETLGRMAADRDDVAIVTNEDPYDEDPEAIIDQVADAAAKAGLVEGESLLRILDRQEAIDRAVALAGAGDLVLITGKGSEPVMAVARGKKIPWDDRRAARLALTKAGYETP